MIGFRRPRMRTFEQHGEKYLLLALAGSFILLVVMLLFAFSGKSRLQKQLDTSLEMMAASVQSDVYNALTVYRTIDHKSADVEGDILPTMKRHMYSAYSMNRVLKETFGDEYSLIDDEAYNEFESVMREFDRVLSAGQSTKAAKESLVPCMNGFQNMILNRFTEEGELIPLTD